MKFLRIVMPFLFVRNWHTGQWEFSSSRLILFSLIAGLVIIGVLVMFILQAPVSYQS